MPLTTSTKLKLLGVDVASFGDAFATTPGALEVVYADPPADEPLRTLSAKCATWASIAYGNGTFVAVASSGGNAATSADGVTWVARGMPSAAAWSAVTFGAAMPELDRLYHRVIDDLDALVQAVGLKAA